MNRLSKQIAVYLFAIAFSLSLSWAVGSIVVEKVSWYLVDHIKSGAVRIENYVLERKMRTGLSNYQRITETMFSKLDDPMYTFQDFKNDEKAKLSYELQFINIADRIIDSYRRNKS